MKAYIVRTGKIIEPFNELPCDCLIGNKTLAMWQQECFLMLGIKPIVLTSKQQIKETDEYIIVGDNVYFTPELLIEFVTRSQQKKKNTICSLKHGVTTQRTISNTQNVSRKEGYVEYNLRYLPKEKFRKEDSVPIIIDPDQTWEYLPIPKHICDSEKYTIPLTERFIIQIDHWANLWAANIITVLAEAARLQKKPKIKLLLMAARVRSFNKWRVLSGANKIGRNCEIHPTAYIEGSIIDDNVKVGAGTIIRESMIGNGTFIGNSVTIEESVIGQKSTILHGHILYSVLYSGVFSVAQMISASFVGKDSFIASGVTLTDFRLDRKNVTILKDGIQIDSGNKFLGCCLGNNVYLGSGCVVAPGRTIPSGLHIALEKNSTITECNFEKIAKGFRLIKD